MKLRSLGSRAGACACLLVGVQAWGAAEPSRDASGNRAEELVITAERRATDLQKTPISATVLTGEDLIKKGVDTLTELAYAAPSVTITDYGSANVFNIRGIGRSKVDVEVPSGVVIYRDGVPTITGYFQNEPYYDMGAVEVLRGPQGTFVGKSAAGGAVFIRTRDPELGDFGGYVEGGAGEFDRYELNGAVNMPVGDTLAVRLSGYLMQRDDNYDKIEGPYSGDPATRDLRTARIGVLWQPTDRFNALLKTDISDLDFGGNPVSSYRDDMYDIRQDAPFEYKDEGNRTVLKLDYEMDNGATFSSLSGYQYVDTVNNTDLNGTASPLRYWFRSAGDFTLYSQEFNLVSPEDQKLRWVTGVFVQQQVGHIPSWQEHGFTFTGGPFTQDMTFPWATSPWKQEQIDRAVFAQVAYDLTETLELQVGGRYSEYELEQKTNFTWFAFVPGSPPIFNWPGTGDDKETQDLKEDATDWKVALNWTMNENHFFYAIVANGHVSSGINIFPPFLPYDQMEVDDYEIGWKATLFDGQLRTQVDFYYEVFDNYQADFRQIGSTPAVSTFRNAEDDSEIYGMEVSAQMVFGNLSVDLGIGLLDSELGTFEDVADPFNPGAFVDLTGAKSPFSPEKTGNIGVEYAFQIAGFSVTPRVDVAYIEHTQASLFDAPIMTLDSRTLVNAQLRFDNGGPWVATLWSTNALDEEYIGGIQNNGELFYAGAPREYGLRVNYSFDNQ